MRIHRFDPLAEGWQVVPEEGGLRGSRFNAQQVDPDAVVAVLNIDMIGRNANDDPANANQVFIIGSDRISTDLHNINEDANAALAPEAAQALAEELAGNDEVTALAITAGVGYDFWIAPEWSIGVFGRFTYGALKDTDSDLDASYPTIAPALLASARLVALMLATLPKWLMDSVSRAGSSSMPSPAMASTDGRTISRSIRGSIRPTRRG